ncbi:response regulator [Lysobacter tyrosinilyticus]
MHAMIDWANSLFGAFPLIFLEIWGRFGYAIGLCLVVCAFGGITLRPNGTWGLGRQRTRWDTKALLSVVLTIVLVMGSGYLGSSIVLVQGAQTLESLKDAMVFVCIVLFGYPAVIGALIAYVMSDMIEGIAPEIMWRWGEAMLMTPAYHWLGNQFLGKDPDFRKLRTWGWYALFLAIFMALYPPLWGYACGPLSGVFPPEISYHKIVPALFFTLVITWILAPFLMLVALPLARRFGLYWAEIPGRVRERAFGSPIWTWESGRGTSTSELASPGSGLPIRILIAAPFVALMLFMVGLIAFLSLRSGENATNEVAGRLNAEIARNVTMQADDALAAPALDAGSTNTVLTRLLRNAEVAMLGRAYIVDDKGRVVASSEARPARVRADDESAVVLDTALSTIRQQAGGIARITQPRSFRFAIVAMDPFGGESWLARITPYRNRATNAQWWLITALPESSYLGSIRQGNSRAAMVFTAALIIAVLMAAYLSNLVTNPLRRISTTAQALARGDLTQRVPGSGLEELKTLSDTFNHMVKQLQDSFAEIRSGEEKLRTVLDSSPLAISWANSQGQIEFWNRKALALFGYALQEIDTVDKWFKLAYPDPDYRRHAIERWNAVSATGPEAYIYEGEYRITCKDGRIVTAEIVGSRYRDLTLVIFNDITERKQAEEALRQASDRLQVATRAADICIWDWDVVRNELVWDDAMYRLYGISREGFTGAYEAWRNAVHSEDIARVEAAIQSALRGEREYSEEFRILRPDGEQRYIHASSRTSRDNTGMPLRMVGVNYDITERKIAEDELRRHRDHLEEIVAERTAQLQRVLLLNEQAMELTRSGYWSGSIDQPTHYTSSPRCAEILGEPAVPDWKYELANWRSRIEAVSPDIANEIDDRYLRACAGEFANYDASYPYLRPADGRVVWVHSRGVIDKDPATGQLQMYGVVQDITDIVEARHQLEEARTSAEAASQAKSSFLANMSHEIRTPMNAIIGMSHLALKGQEDPAQRQYLEKIQRASQHLLSIINDILDISKIEAGKLTIENSFFTLPALLDDVANVVDDRAAAKGLRLTFDVAPDVPGELVGDRLRLGQILINYATNAVKFTEQGEVMLAVDIAARRQRDLVLRFSVRDTGIGLSQEQIRVIFEAFEQGDSSTTRRYGGTGLGLTISKSLVKLMGGQIGVDSRLGSGSTFWFTVPLGIGEQRKEAADIRGRRLLVAEESDSEGSALCATLTSMGFTVAPVGDARETISAFRESIDSGRPFDVVLLDLDGLGTAALTVAERIKTLAAPREQRVVLVGSTPDPELARRARHAGMAVIAKPIAPSSLFDMLARMLGPVARSRASAPPTAESLGALRGARVLVAEDNEFNQEVAKAILGDAGLVVDIADDGEAAVRMVQSQHYDLVLMDMQMPVMDGLTATREIRLWGQCPGLPILAMTANAMQEDGRRCIEAGMDDFVTKPIDPDHLLSVLLKWIERDDKADASS